MLSRNFSEEEFVCRCGHCHWSRAQSGLVVPELVVGLQRARDALGKPIIVTSGRRCVEHNRVVGGVYGSYHISGMAADVKADDMNALLEELLDVHEFRYIEAHRRYIHVDVGQVRRIRFVDKRN